MDSVSKILSLQTVFYGISNIVRNYFLLVNQFTFFTSMGKKQRKVSLDVISIFSSIEQSTVASLCDIFAIYSR